MSNYKNYAYERTVVAELQRILVDCFIASDSPPKKTITCEEVFFSESEVPQDALVRVFEKLSLWEQEQRNKMSEFKWKVDPNALPFIKATERTDSKEEPVRHEHTRAKKRK